MRIYGALFCFVLVAGCSGPGASPLAGNQSPASALRGPAGNYRNLYEFKGGTDGANPTATLVELNGTLYGTTTAGGNAGTVFAITASGSESVLHSFTGHKDGASPTAALTVVNGTLYGVTFAGGGSGCFAGTGCGIVFAMSPSGSETVLHSFGLRGDGKHPSGPLTYANGKLYGVTEHGGAHDCGTVFEIGPSGKERVLYSFKGIPDGCQPSGNLAFLRGALYGTTSTSGAHTAGCVFKVSLTGQESVLHSFAGKDGIGPVSGLIAFGGKLYGTTPLGGTPQGLGHGVVFAISPSGDERTIYAFTVRVGQGPYAGLIAYNGALYGTTVGQTAGANQKRGSVYDVTASGAESTLHVFKRSPADGPAHPYGGLIAVNGVLYGTTNEGGATNDGVVFALTP
jgi:uncharacterized repeat protein (TIGR03803 family)